MADTLKLGTASNKMVFMTDATSHIDGATGLTLTITASKNGAAFASITPTVTDRGNGWYNLALTTSHVDTLGDLAIHITASGADPTDLKYVVGPILPDVNAAKVGGEDAIPDEDMATEVAAIKAKTDNLPSDPADASVVAASFGTVNTTLTTLAGYVDTEVSAIKSKTDLIPANPAAVGSAMTLDMTQAVPTSNTAQTVGDSLNAARAQAFGRWVKTGTSLVLYAANGSTVVRTFTLDDADAPTSRT